jgi:4-hydroxybenzoate polyprenyltransferase
MKRVFDIIVNNRIHVFLIPIAVTLFWNLALQLPLPVTYYILIMANTAGNYIYNMLTDLREDAVNYPEEGRIVGPNNRWTRPLILLFFLISMGLGALAGWRFLLYGFILNIFGAYYGAPIKLPGGKIFRVKNVPVLKNAYSALFWSVALLLTPYLYIHRAPGPALILSMIIAFLMAFFVELLWDVRDVRGDKLAGVRTLPVLLGDGVSKFILHLLNLVILLLVLFGVRTGSYPVSFYVIVVHFLIAFFFLNWYFRQPNKQFGSHFYLVIALTTIAIAYGIKYSFGETTF